MLSKNNRIKDKKLFPQIIKSGKRFYCPYFILFVYNEPLTQKDFKVGNEVAFNGPSKKQLPAQFGFVTSKKVGGAVDRNKTRRIFSEIIRLELPKIKSNTKAVLIAHKNAVEKDYAEIQAEIQKQLSLAGLYK